MGDQYESYKKVSREIFENSTSILLIDGDDYPSMDEYSPDFRNPHEDILGEFFKREQLTPIDDARKLVFLKREGDEVLKGSVLDAGSNPYDTAKYMTLQASRPGVSSPVYIAKIDMLKDAIEVVIDGGGKVIELKGVVSSSEMYRMINKIYLDAKAGYGEYPDDGENPFLYLAHDIKQINRRDFSRY